MGRLRIPLLTRATAPRPRLAPSIPFVSPPSERLVASPAERGRRVVPRRLISAIVMDIVLCLVVLQTVFKFISVFKLVVSELLHSCKFVHVNSIRRRVRRRRGFGSPVVSKHSKLGGFEILSKNEQHVVRLTLRDRVLSLSVPL